MASDEARARTDDFWRVSYEGRPRSARDVKPDESWGFTDYRTLAEVKRAEGVPCRRAAA